MLQAYGGEKERPGERVEEAEEKEYGREFDSRIGAGEKKKIEQMKDPSSKISLK